MAIGCLRCHCCQYRNYTKCPSIKYITFSYINVIVRNVMKLIEFETLIDWNEIKKYLRK